ncbi:MAG: carbohydrate ABC transporter permease [Lachnospiraceae bacterium]|nr:carbohydrate ABC transporter permease [Lachnospiraceae bacterium]
MKKRITGGMIFDAFNIFIMLMVIVASAYPFLYVVVASFSDPTELARHQGILLMPLQPFTLEAYKMTFQLPQLLTGYINTIFYVVVGVAVNLIMTTLGAYFLSMDGPMHKNIVAFMVIFTMYFSGGMIPSYLNIKDLGLMDSRWALILPGAISVTNMVILRTAFQNVPSSLREAAEIDGATIIQVLFKVMLPLVKSTLAVLVLYYGVAHWNAWFEASIYLIDKDKYPVQLIVQQLLSSLNVTEDIGDLVQYVELIRYAIIVVTTAPILVLYPFLQKHFAKGVMIGALKG